MFTPSFCILSWKQGYGCQAKFLKPWFQCAPGRESPETAASQAHDQGLQFLLSGVTVWGSSQCGTLCSAVTEGGTDPCSESHQARAVSVNCFFR